MFAIKVATFGRKLKVVSRDHKGRFQRIDIAVVSGLNRTKNIQITCGLRIVRTMPVKVACDLFAHLYANKIQCTNGRRFTDMHTIDVIADTINGIIQCDLRSRPDGTRSYSFKDFREILDNHFEGFIHCRVTVPQYDFLDTEYGIH